MDIGFWVPIGDFSTFSFVGIILLLIVAIRGNPCFHSPRRRGSLISADLHESQNKNRLSPSFDIADVVAPFQEKSKRRIATTFGVWLYDQKNILE
jgi:hypothetical protein